VKLEHLLLGILLVKPRTGYDLSRYMEMEGVFMRPRTQMSQVYRSLSQMADRGWTQFAVSSRPGAQDAKIYSVTELGREVFLTWLHSEYAPSLEQVNYEFRARVFFSGFRDEAALIDLITTEIDARRRQIAKYRYRDRTIETDPDGSFDLDLVSQVEDIMHANGAEAMDRMVANLESLRETVRARLAKKERTDAERVGA